MIIKKSLAQRKKSLQRVRRPPIEVPCVPPYRSPALRPRAAYLCCESSECKAGSNTRPGQRSRPNCLKVLHFGPGSPDRMAPPPPDRMSVALTRISAEPPAVLRTSLEIVEHGSQLVCIKGMEGVVEDSGLARASFEVERVLVGDDDYRDIRPDLVDDRNHLQMIESVPPEAEDTRPWPAAQGEPGQLYRRAHRANLCPSSLRAPAEQGHIRWPAATHQKLSQHRHVFDVSSRGGPPGGCLAGPRAPSSRPIDGRGRIIVVDLQRAKPVPTPDRGSGAGLSF